MWDSMREGVSRPNQKVERACKSLPLLGMPFWRMMSKAEMRSVATKRMAPAWGPSVMPAS